MTQRRDESYSPFGELGRAGVAWLSAAQEAWSRSLEISTRYLAGDSDWKKTSQDNDGKRDWVSDWRHFTSEMALVPFLAAARFGKELDAEPDAVEPRTLYRVNLKNDSINATGEADKELRLPTHIQNACQAVAVYLVSHQRVQEILEAATSQKEPPFQAVHLGGDTTPAIMIGCDYDKDDLDNKQEFGVAFMVVPKGNPNAVPGLFVNNLLVNSPLSFVARKIWGYPKTMANLKPVINQDTFRVSATDPDRAEPIFSASFPRGGSGSTTAIPVTFFTLKDVDVAGMSYKQVPHATTFLRTGRGERVRQGSGGAKVSLAADLPKDSPNYDVWHVLKELEIDKREPVLHSWTERLSGEFRASRPLPGTIKVPAKPAT